MRWLLRILLAVLAWRLLRSATRSASPRPSAPRNDPDDAAGRVKTRARPGSGLADLTPHPIEDAEFEELPRRDP